MDFVEGLPKSGSSDTILVVVDKFSKYNHFIPLAHPFTAASVANLFMTHIYKLHGMPSAIVSDRDKVFTSQLWKALFNLAGVQLMMSTSYHPQIDGQTERVNQCLETFLCCFVHACPKHWLKWLHLAEFWINTSRHSALSKSPFEVLYGYAPRVFGISPADAHPVSDVHTWLQDRALMQLVIKLHLHHAQDRMKRQADKKCSECVFEVGDQLFLKLQPYVQSSLAPRANQKLSFKFFGPFPIVAKIGAVAYKLQLPPSSSIHLVFHVSQLKKAVPPTHQVTPHVPDSSDAYQVPVAILQRRLSAVSGRSATEGLVQWSG